MEWISVKNRLPKQDWKSYQYILVLVNGNPYICYMPCLEGCIFLSEGKFIYTEKNGFCGDERFAKPTHWMPLPEAPKE